MYYFLNGIGMANSKHKGRKEMEESRDQLVWMLDGTACLCFMAVPTHITFTCNAAHNLCSHMRLQEDAEAILLKSLAFNGKYQEDLGASTTVWILRPTNQGPYGQLHKPVSRDKNWSL